MPIVPYCASVPMATFQSHSHKHEEVEERYCEKEAVCSAFVYERATKICDLKDADISDAIIGKIKMNSAMGKTLGLNGAMLNCETISSNSSSVFI